MTEQVQTSRKFCIDKLSLDPDVQITETSEFMTVDPVTLIREGVYPYEDGMVLKPGDELAKGAAVSRLYVAWDHPPLRIITQPQEIKGTVDGLRAEKDSNGVKIKGRLSFIKNRLTADQLELIRSKVRRDVSLGFYFTIDRTPGSWNGQRYDYVQRNYVFDHVASVDHGRCPFPKCGIGVDAGGLNVQAGIGANMQIGNDPYPNEHSCRLKEPGQFEANSFRRIRQGKVSLILAKKKGQTTMTVQAIRYPTASWSEAEARSNCAGRKGSFEPASSAKSDTVMTKEESDTSTREKFSQKEVNFRPGDENRPDAICGNCIFRDWVGKIDCSIVEGTIADNMTCDENTPKPTLERWVLGVKRGNASDEAALPKEEPYKETMSRDNAAKFLRELSAMDRPTLVRMHERQHKSPDFTPESRAHRCVLFALGKKKTPRTV